MPEKGIEMNFQLLPAPPSRHLHKAGSSSPLREEEVQGPVAWSRSCGGTGAMLGYGGFRPGAVGLTDTHHRPRSLTTDTAGCALQTDVAVLGQCAGCSSNVTLICLGFFLFHLSIAVLCLSPTDSQLGRQLPSLSCSCCSCPA